MRIGTYRGSAEYQCEQCGQEFSVPVAEARDDDAWRACVTCKRRFASVKTPKSARVGVDLSEEMEG